MSHGIASRVCMLSRGVEGDLLEFWLFARLVHSRSCVKLAVCPRKPSGAPTKLVSRLLLGFEGPSGFKALVWNPIGTVWIYLGWRQRGGSRIHVRLLQAAGCWDWNVGAAERVIQSALGRKPPEKRSNRPPSRRKPNFIQGAERCGPREKMISTSATEL